MGDTRTLDPCAEEFKERYRDFDASWQTYQDQVRRSPEFLTAYAGFWLHVMNLLWAAFVLHRKTGVPFLGKPLEAYNVTHYISTQEQYDRLARGQNQIKTAYQGMARFVRTPIPPSTAHLEPLAMCCTEIELRLARLIRAANASEQLLFDEYRSAMNQAIWPDGHAHRRTDGKLLYAPGARFPNPYKVLKEAEQSYQWATRQGATVES